MPRIIRLAHRIKEIISKLTEKNYPQVDLNDEKIIREQRDNIKRFQVLWRRVMVGVVGSFAVFFIGVKLVPPDQARWLVLMLFMFMIPTVFFVIMYKCPNCKAVPTGTAVSIGLRGISYSKGVHPFPKRCDCCGFYLSERALKKDLRTSQPDAEQIT
ncbi:hypothetical protein [Duganella sp. CF402]|uniref:hypothetical protein n=2 Tax=unclassified Duganella TaxID=2636909 RepID=UPI001028F116|nr:hypothetical protein [Duganella sp. CF402]